MKAYRYESVRFCTSIDESDNGYRLSVELCEFDVVKTTPKGFWIAAYTAKRFVRASGKKRFACLTKEDALKSFIARKERQVAILTVQLRDAREAITIANNK